MIKKIIKMKFEGVFSDYEESAGLSQFSRYNIIYGWNGVGKSTLARVLSVLESTDYKDVPPHLKFQFQLDADQKISETDFLGVAPQIRIFNREYVDKHIDWDHELKSFLLLDQKEIHLQHELTKEKEAYSELSGKVKERAAQQEDLNGKKDKFLKDRAKYIKDNLQVIVTKDSYYFNYDKSKALKKISSSLDVLKDGSKKLTSDEYSTALKASRPESKNFVAKIVKIDQIEFEQKIDLMNQSLEKQITKSFLDNLLKDSAINSWVFEGHKIHKDKALQSCSFCEGIISKDRLTALDKHYSAEYEMIMRDLGVYRKFFIDFKSLAWGTDGNGLFSEFEEEFNKAAIENNRKQKVFFSEIDNLIESVDIKIKNPFELVAVYNKRLILSHISDLNQKCEIANLIVEKHNQKVSNLAEVVKSNQEKLELHMLTEGVQAANYFTIEEDIEKVEKEIGDLKNELAAKKSIVDALERKIGSEILATDEFNRKLHSFLGHKEISLYFDEKRKAFKLQRSDSSEVKKLSEGEKSAIAFIYFSTKIFERGQTSEDLIVVIDDPISSFDSNHIFSCASMIASNFVKAKQLFILTHNFEFFRELRAWLTKGEERKASEFYTIVNRIADGQRRGYIEGMSKSLLNYNSEYHYVYETVYKYKDTDINNLDTLNLIGNLARKMTEGFLCIRYPSMQQTGGINLKDAIVIKHKDIFPEEKLNRIYRFLNHFSHLSRTDAARVMPDLSFDEYKNVLNDTFDFIKTIDQTHFDEMSKSINF